MDSSTRLRRHLGESACLTGLRSKTGPRLQLIDFTKTRRGDEITLIEVGEHGVTVEYEASGHKDIIPFSDIKIKDRFTTGRRRLSKTHRPSSRRA